MKMTLNERLENWRVRGDADTGREVALWKMPKIPLTPEHIVAPTKIRRTGRGFLVKGRAVAMGETVTVPRNIALDLVYLKKAELVV